MRLKLYFELENKIFPIQYRKSILSFIKLSLSEYSPAYFNKLYHEKDCIIKPYTFAVFLYGPTFNQESIQLKDKAFELNISIEDYEIGIILYNAFNHQRNKKFALYQNSWKLQEIALLPEKQIDTDRIKVKFLSPLVVRDRNQQMKKDYYHSFGDKEFKDVLKINIKEELKISNLPANIVDTFDIKPIDPKKVVIKFYEKQIESSLGTYELIADPKLLTYLYKAGVGSKRSCGFGMFNII